MAAKKKAAKKTGDAALVNSIAYEQAAVKAAPIAIVAETVQSRVPAVAGTSTRDKVEGRVTDLRALLLFLADNIGEADQAVTFSKSWLNSVAKSGRTVPGVGKTSGVKTAM